MKINRIVLIALLLAFNSEVNAKFENVDMPIKLNNNAYNISTHCSKNRAYEFVFESKDHLFEKYHLANSDTVLFSTDKYAIHLSSVIPENRSLIRVIVDEIQFKNIFKAAQLRVDFDVDIFNDELMREKSKMGLSFEDLTNPYMRSSTDKSKVKPNLKLSIKKDHLSSYIKKCTEEQNIYKKKNSLFGSLFE